MMVYLEDRIVIAGNKKVQKLQSYVTLIQCCVRLLLKCSYLGVVIASMLNF